MTKKISNKDVGLTPADYYLRQRMFLAKQKLWGSPKSITEIALGLGVSSSQYFATIFKKIVGVILEKSKRFARKIPSSPSKRLSFLVDILRNWVFLRSTVA